ncbi:MAG: GspH/FimT family pseudopilin [Gammaproteobacteria bacterium]
MPRAQNQYGFTIMELMISIAILFIVTAIGIPGYISYVRNGSRDNTVTDLYSNMNYARSEAIKLNTNVSMCRAGNTTAANAACGGTARNWTTGWLIFVDNNNNGDFDPGERLLKIGAPIKNGIQVMASTTADPSISFLNDGSLKIVAGGTATFAVCDDRDNDGTYDKAYGRDISISAMGRPEITSKISTCNP